MSEHAAAAAVLYCVVALFIALPSPPSSSPPPPAAGATVLTDWLCLLVPCSPMLPFAFPGTAISLAACVNEHTVLFSCVCMLIY